MSNRRTAAVIVLAAVLCAACGGRTGQDAMTVAPVLRARELPIFVGRNREGERLWSLTKQFYQKRGEAPAWIDGRKPRPQMDELIAALQRTDREGLDPALYNAAVLSARRAEAGRGFLSMKGFQESEAANLDVWLTYLYLQYASDLTSGIASLSHADPTWRIPDKKADLLTVLEQALDQNQIARSLDGLTPTHLQYTGLRDALAKYREIEQRGGWPAVPLKGTLKPGERNTAVAVLARRLAATGDYTATPGDANMAYGAELQEAVKRFQRRHGLEPDGVVSAATVAQLNVPVAQRV